LVEEMEIVKDSTPVPHVSMMLIAAEIDTAQTSLVKILFGTIGFQDTPEDATATTTIVTLTTLLILELMDE